MKTLDRRQFIRTSAAGFSSALLLSRLPKDFDDNSFSAFSQRPIGFQVYPIRDLIAKDFAGTLKMMNNLGYQTVEMCSPPGYISSGFGSLVNMKSSEMRRIINDAGLTCESCHYTFKEFKDNLDERIEFAGELGLKQMILSSFSLPSAATLSDYLKAADDLNKIGLKTQKAGIQREIGRAHV
jgi:hypothetical protein